MKTPQTIYETVEMTVMRCGHCGITHAMPEFFRLERKEDGASWYCPNGHPRVYRESDVFIARRERDEALAKLSAAKCETAAERIAREAAEKKLQRVSKGVCPCCKRSFVNVRRHIANKHPKFAPAKVERKLP